MKPAMLLLLVAAFAVACKSGSSSPAQPTTPNTGGAGSTNATVTIDGDAYLPGGTAVFTPTSLTIAPGTTVNWSNRDQTAHTTTANNGTWNSGSISGGGSFSRQFNAVGSFDYRCTLHPAMTGTITVR